jgi:hypothetical protein
LFFEALTGKPPFRGENEMAMRWAHANDPRPTASSIVPALGQRYDSFFAVALAVDPDQRSASGRDFAEALKGAYSGESETAVMPAASAAHPPTAVGPATPLPPSVTPQPPPPGYPAYGYVTPPPAPVQQSKSGNPLALILLGLVAIAGVAVGALAAAGVFSNNNTTQTVTSISNTVRRRPAKQATTIATTVPKDAKPCGSGLSVGPATTCPFAENVRQAYEQSGASGAAEVSAYSPSTGLTYTMHCTGGPTHVCTGGNSASVYFESAESTPATSASTGGGGLRPCDPNISANSAASCPFAENVFRSYWRRYTSNGQQSEAVVSAYSPTTEQSYSMDCTTEGVTVECSGGSEAFVTFPLHAVEVY